MLAALAGGSGAAAGELASRAGLHPRPPPRTCASWWTAVWSGSGAGPASLPRVGGAEVGAVLEALAPARPAGGNPLATGAAGRHRHPPGADCYDHLAGRRGVQLRDRLLEVDALRSGRLGSPVDSVARADGRLDVDVDACWLRRVFARRCVTGRTGGHTCRALRRRSPGSSWPVAGCAGHRRELR